jgi:hypothetical protein
MKNTGLMIFLLIIIQLKALAQLTTNEIELYHDDNVVNDAIVLERYATRFSPPAESAQVMKIKYYFTSIDSGNSFKFTIYNDNQGTPQSEIMIPITISGGQAGWNEFDLSQLNIFIDGDFYFYLTYHLQSFPSLGIDTQLPIQKQTLYNGA